MFLVALNLRNSKLLIKNIADKSFVAWYYIYPVSVLRRYVLPSIAHFWV